MRARYGPQQWLGCDLIHLRIGRTGSMRTAHRKWGIALAAMVGVALLGVVAPQSAQAASPYRFVTAGASGGIPALVRPSANLGAQVPGPEVTWVDSIFIAGRVRGGGHDFGILIHTLAFPNADQRKLFISITDTTAGWYRNYAAVIPKNKYSWSRKGLHIAMPGHLDRQRTTDAAEGHDAVGLARRPIHTPGPRTELLGERADRTARRREL